MTLKCTISGSFRRFWSEIKDKMKSLSSHGIDVLSPLSTEIEGEIEGFVLLRGDTGAPKEIEGKHLSAIKQSDFLYVVDPGGYIGPSATLEIGFAIAHSIPVFCSEPPVEPMLAAITASGGCVETIISALHEDELHIPHSPSLLMLQSYVRKMVKARGFDHETLRDVVLLLVEEIGELAKATRRTIRLKVGQSNHREGKSVALELADCLIYLLDIANLANVDLEAAFREKEEINSKKTWRIET